jgi:hypothetical protein
VDGFIEKTDIKNARKDVNVNFEVSPADPTFYGLFASLHTTMHAAQTSGHNTISINALPDAAVNVLQANLTGGQQLVLDVGLGAQETVTIAAGGVPATTPGYTSATLTLTANLTQNHAISAGVCEPLPSGVTSPTTWDTAAVFGAAKFAY